MTALLARYQAKESGFFHWAQHIDSLGLWIYSSLSQPFGVAQIRKYEAPMRCQDVLKFLNGAVEKYPQKGLARPWKGIVLAAQIPTDRAVRVVAEHGFDYWKFIAKACRKYRDRLFIKLHPCLRGEPADRHRLLAKEVGGVQCGFATMDILRECEYVLVYNSTFAVDAWLHGKPVMQYAPGYFAGCGAVTFTDGRMSDELEDCGEMPQKMLDFLIWRYCWHQDCPDWWKKEIHRVYARAEELFPLPEHLSYAGFLKWSLEEGDGKYVRKDSGPWLSST